MFKRVAVSLLLGVFVLTSTACSGKPDGTSGEVITFEDDDYEDFSEGDFSLLRHLNITRVENDIEQMVMQYMYYVLDFRDELIDAEYFIEEVIEDEADEEDIREVYETEKASIIRGLQEARENTQQMRKIQPLTSHPDALRVKEIIDAHTELIEKTTILLEKEFKKGKFVERQKQLEKRYENFGEEGGLLYKEHKKAFDAQDEIQELLDEYDTYDTILEFVDYLW